MTDIPKHELLLKLLKMTGSDNDAEALVAIRKATALLSSAGWDWDKLLSGKITVVGDPFGNLQRPPPSQSNYQAKSPARPVPRPPQGPTRAAYAPSRAAYAATPRAKGRPAPPSYDDIFGSF